MSKGSGQPSKEVEERVAQLRAAITQYRFDYHVLNQETISPEALDTLKRELSALEAAYPSLVTPDSPTQRVAGEPLPEFKKVTHEVRQWSFNDAFTEEDIREFDDRMKRTLGVRSVAYCAELKIDGLKVVLTYERGILTTAATRGDGEVGEDVTHNVRTIPSVPLTLTRPIDCIVEGEVWMSKKSLALLNAAREKEGEQPFANPRNAAAGSIRQLDPQVAAKRALDVFVYDVARSSEPLPATQHEELAYLDALGFMVNPHARVVEGSEGLIAFWHSWATKKDHQPYLIDGVVAKVNARTQQEALGYTGKAPRFGVALKFAPEQVTTVLEGIHFQVGRTGVVTPVAHLRPVDVAGVVVRRATLHNEDQIKRLDVRIGDTLVVQRAGDVIPEIVSVVLPLRPKSAKPYVWPTHIDACGEGGEIERVPGQAAWRCKSKNSAALIKRKLYHFVSRKAMNIDGCGPKTIDLLLEHGLIESYEDLYTLSKKDLVGLPSFGELAAQNLIDGIAARRRPPLDAVLTALSIDQVGEETARLIAAHFGTIGKVRAASVEQLAALHGVGDVVARAVYDWFRNSSNAAHLDALLTHITPQRVEKIEAGRLSGKSFVITGTLASMSREEAESRVRSEGGSASSSVSKKTSYVVAGAAAGSKLDKARALGVTVLDEAAFLQLLRQA